MEYTQPPSQRVSEALSPRIKRPGREADHSPPSSAEVKNAWSYASTHPTNVFMAQCLVKNRGNFNVHKEIYFLTHCSMIKSATIHFVCNNRFLYAIHENDTEMIYAKSGITHLD
jgi:hypothetical protein